MRFQRQHRPSAHFDAEAATNAYLAQIPADKTARSDAYFEGGYWLILWDFLYGAVVALAAAEHALVGQICATWPSASRASSRYRLSSTGSQYLLVAAVLAFPLSVYEDYFREHKYGLATQTFGPWMCDQLKGLGAGSGAGRNPGDRAAVRCCAASTADVVDLGRGRDVMYS